MFTNHTLFLAAYSVRATRMNSYKSHAHKKRPDAAHEPTRQLDTRGHVMVCPLCRNVKYQKQWHAPDSKAARLLSSRTAKTILQRCPACVMKAQGRYAAIVSIHDVPRALRDTIEELIHHEGEDARAHNPQNRIIEVVETIDGYAVRTTSPKLARTIGGHLKNQFHSSEIITRAKRRDSADTKPTVVLEISEYLTAFIV